jgi:2,4-dienoyl-CoA reductase-like NADH-dependent reductase (Old Yellow Enzyme family)
MSQFAMPIGQPFELPCGLKLSNRIVKAAMEESLGSGDNQPDEYIYRLYERWAKGSFGLLLTGNVQIDERYPGFMEDLMIPSKDKIDIERWKRYADICQSYGTPTIVQINHAGRQSLIGKRPFKQPAIAPSPIPMSIGENLFARALQRYLIGTPEEMTRAQIEEVIGKFADAAEIMAKAGFAGVEIHGSHGYLVSSFLSPKTNTRKDEYGATPKDRMKFLFRIIDAIRAVVPQGFAVGVKLNSADFSAGGLTEEEAHDQIRWINEHGSIDFIEISGGTYEAPAMAGIEHQPQSQRTRKREAYFIEFAARVRSTTTIPLIVTGGFRTRQGMNEAIHSNACDFVGIGRPACIQFNLPEILLDKNIPDKDARALEYNIRGTYLFNLIPIRGVGSGIGTIWHNWQMHRVAIENREPDHTLTVHGKLITVLFNILKKFIPSIVLLFGIIFISILIKQFFFKNQ